MISILIPVFNRDVTLLAQHLREQVSRQPVAVEVLVMDDASRSAAAREANAASIRHLPGFRYFELTENAGRNLIRQRLAAEARYPVFIFLDADSYFPDERWLDRFVEAAREPGVIAGGRVYREIEESLLHYRHGKARETASALRRSRHPYRSFMTNNFLITRHDFNQLVIDPCLRGYGHEDTFIGLQLQQLGIPVRHIQNPVFHEAVEDDGSFMIKQEEAMQNLCRLYREYGKKYRFRQNVRLVNLYERCKAAPGGEPLLGRIAKAKDYFRRKLMSSHRLVWLDLWKLAAFHEGLQRHPR